MDEKYLIAGVGELLWDILPDSRQMGGAPANFVCHAGKMNTDAYLISAVGDDRDGSDILRRLESMPVNRKFVQIDQQHPTGTVTVHLDENGVPSYVIHENVAWDNIRWTEELRQLARKCDAACFGTLAQRCDVSMNTIHDFIASTPPECLRVLDVNFRQVFYNEEIVSDSLELANVLKLSEEELEMMARILGLPPHMNDQLSTLRDKYALKWIAVTRGPRGSVMVNSQCVSDCPGFDPADLSMTEGGVGDTVGAGDAFTAAMTIGILSGHDIEEINTNANRIAAFVCSQPGATPDLPDKYVTALKQRV